MNKDEWFGLGFCVGVILAALVSVMNAQHDAEVSRAVASVTK